MRILAMDVGDRRIGVAVSDPLGFTAQGIDTLIRKNITSDINKISDMIEKYNPHKIVLGMPKNMNGTLGIQGEKVLKFGKTLKKCYNGDIVYWDERLTTVSAHRVMMEGNVSGLKRKRKVDKLAAVIILQGYLDYINNQLEGD